MLKFSMIFGMSENGMLLDAASERYLCTDRCFVSSVFNA